MNSSAIVIIMASLLNLLLLMIGPMVMGYGLVLLLFGQQDPHVATCNKCRTVLAREALAVGHGCPSCGSTPLVTAAARTSARWRGILFFVLPIVVWSVLIVLFSIGITSTLTLL